MTSRTGVVSIAPASTTTATTTPWPLPALPGALRLHALPRFSLEALYRNPRRSTVNYGTCLKIIGVPGSSPLVGSLFPASPRSCARRLTLIRCRVRLRRIAEGESNPIDELGEPTYASCFWCLSE